MKKTLLGIGITTCLLLNACKQSNLTNTVSYINDLLPKSKDEIIKNNKNIWNLRLGMGEKEVQSIMGSPLKISKTQNTPEEEVWIFRNYTGKDELRCVFNSDKKVVFVQRKNGNWLHAEG